MAEVTEINSAELNRYLDVYQQLASHSIDYFHLLELSKTATQMDIDAAYEKWKTRLSPLRIRGISALEAREKVERVRQAVERGYQVLSDYKERGAYEKRGYKEKNELEPEPEDPHETARDLYRRARSLSGRKQFQAAVVAMEEAVRIDGEKAEYLLLLGKCQSMIPGLKRKAESNLVKVTELEPWNPDPFAALGMIFYSEKLFNRAESYFRKALAVEPAHALARKKLHEIAPERDSSLKASVKSVLKKSLPSIFDRKK